MAKAKLSLQQRRAETSSAPARSSHAMWLPVREWSAIRHGRFEAPQSWSATGQSPRFGNDRGHVRSAANSGNPGSLLKAYCWTWFKLRNRSARIMRYGLSDYEWSVIRPMLPNKPRGVPRVDDRRVLDEIFWILRSGAPGRDLPEVCGPHMTCYNRFVRWRRAGVWEATEKDYSTVVNEDAGKLRRLYDENPHYRDFVCPRSIDDRRISGHSQAEQGQRRAS